MSTHDTRTVDAPAATLLDDATTEARALTFRDPGVPVTLEELAALRRASALDVLDARNAIVETARKMGIRLTHPEDWVLNKSPDGRITAYLQDDGADRLRDILGVEIDEPPQPPERIQLADGFMYIVRSSGRSTITGQKIGGKEGGRVSTDKFFRDIKGAELELKVRKAARANLDGNITRELTGLNAMPIGELAACWEGTGKSTEHCRKGHGFGSQDERHGGTREGAPQVEPPTCPACAPVNGAPVRLAYRAPKGDRKAFYGCPNFEKHPDRRVIVNADEWIAGAATRAAATPAGKPATTPAREPGSDD